MNMRAQELARRLRSPNFSYRYASELLISPSAVLQSSLKSS